MNGERRAYRGEVPIILRIAHFVSIAAWNYCTRSMSRCEEMKYNIHTDFGNVQIVVTRLQD